MGYCGFQVMDLKNLGLSGKFSGILEYIFVIYFQKLDRCGFHSEVSWPTRSNDRRLALVINVQLPIEEACREYCSNRRF